MKDRHMEIAEVAALFEQLMIFRSLKDEPLIRRLITLAQANNANTPKVPADWYGSILELHPHEPNPWTCFLVDRIVSDANYFSLACERGGYSQVAPKIIQAVKSDLAVLLKLCRWSPDEAASFESGSGVFPESDESTPFNNGDVPTVLEWLVSRFANGAGDFGKYSAFTWESAMQHFRPITAMDPVTFDQLIGNGRQKETLIRNTRQFLEGFPANNILLYGDRGTGKSSSIKAVGNQFSPSGLRLIEVSKEDLGDFPVIIDRLKHRGLKFIIYVDDLSFETSETQYKHLKAVLEGSLEARPANVLIYATSNRRHLIRETFSDREAEVHGNDAVQEQLSLADRFGLTLTFLTPNQEEYLAIVRGLAAQRQIKMPPPDLEAKAVEWERSQNGRSGRTARQFIDHLQGELGLKSAQGMFV